MHRALLQSRPIDAVTIFIIPYSIFIIHPLRVDHDTPHIDAHHDGAVTLITKTIHTGTVADQMLFVRYFRNRHGVFTSDKRSEQREQTKTELNRR